MDQPRPAGGGVDGSLQFDLGLLAPQHEGHRLGQLPEDAEHRVGEGLPAEFCMAVGLAGIHGEYRVDQQHTGARPGDQAACLRRGKAEIGFTLFIDIAQAAGQRNAGAHGKG